MKRKILNNSGITLLELIVSIAILSIILITFAGLFTNAFKYNAMSGDKLQSVNIAQKYASEIQKNTGFEKFMEDLDIAPKDINLEKTPYKDLGLNLIEDIYQNAERNKDDSNKYYLMKLEDNQLNIFIYIKYPADFSSTSESHSVSLYRLIVEVRNKANKTLSETYLYYKE